MKEQADYILSLCKTNTNWNDNDLKRSLALLINELINTDFAIFIQLLYSLDISEQKIKKCLADNAGTDAGTLIAELIAERQLQKEITRKNFQQQTNIPDEEKW